MLDRRFGLVLAGVVLAAIPQIPGISPYAITLMNFVGLGSLVAIGLVLLTGVGGLTSFGQAAFCGISAYTTAVLTTAYGVSPWLSLPVALILTGIIATLLGLMSLRLSGHYLPLGTLAWGISFYFLFSKFDILGRNDGIAAIPPLSVLGRPLLDDRSEFYIIWAFVLITGVLTTNLLDSRIGRGIRSLRGGAVAASAFGIDTRHLKLVVFVHAAILAGISGWLYAHLQRAVNPTPFGVNAGIEYLFMAVVGGPGYVWGAVLGAAFVIGVKEILQRWLPLFFGTQGSFEAVVFGVLIVLLLQYARGGLWSGLMRILPARRPPKLAAPKGKSLPRRTLPPRGTPLLSVQDVRKAFDGLVAVNDVSFEVKAGAIVGLIGPNGAGKSTTFALLTGLLRLDRGAVTFMSQPIGGESIARIAALGIGRTFQHVKLRPDMTVLENVAVGTHLRGRAGVLASLLRLDRAEERLLLAEAARLVERVGLGDMMHAPVGSLTLGQQRIVEIARALGLDPLLLLLDEPAAGLRHREKERLAQVLQDLRNEGMTILLVEHDMGFLMGLTDHIVVLDFGTKIAEGSPEVVRSDPRVVQAYLGTSA